INTLLGLVREFNIDHRFCVYGGSDDSEISKKPALSNAPDIDHHNSQIEKAIAFLTKDRPSFAILDKGRSPDERSCIWVGNGDFYGMGYLASDVGFNEPSEVREYVTPYRSNQYIMQLIYSYDGKYPGKVVLQKASKTNS